MVVDERGEELHDAASLDMSWDPALVQKVIAVLRPVAKRWYRSQVRGLDRLPATGALIVANHSGGTFAMDIPLLAVDFVDRFGYERPLYTLSHDALLKMPGADFLKRTGFIRASRATAASALRSGGVVVVFPGGDYDLYRPTRLANVIDFHNRVGYVRTAVEAGVPIVPMVSIGGQENQLYLSRGHWLARRLGLKRLLRTEVLPVSIGFPFGLSAILPLNFPLPTKIVTEILEPIDVVAEFGREPDISAVDQHVRAAMQLALDRLAAERRFPVIG